MISIEDRITFLKQRQMFNGVEDEFITEIAESLEEYSLGAEQVLFKEGDPGSVFYFIYQGSVRVWEGSEDGEDMDYGILESGDRDSSNCLPVQSCFTQERWLQEIARGEIEPPVG